MSSKITDRQLESWIDDANSVLNDGGAQVEEMSAASTILALCEHIQECRKADPVADVVAWHREGEERTCDIRWRRHDVAPGPLYAVPQAPKEPTPEMQTAGATAIRFDTTPINKLFTANAVYCAMIAAAPKTNQQ